MKPDERRQAIIELLCQKRHETMKNLASEFGVSIRTICHYVKTLYWCPLFLQCKETWRCLFMEEYRLKSRLLTITQQKLLAQLPRILNGENLEIMLSILHDFALKRDHRALQHLEK